MKEEAPDPAIRRPCSNCFVWNEVTDTAAACSACGTELPSVPKTPSPARRRLFVIFLAVTLLTAVPVVSAWLVSEGRWSLVLEKAAAARREVIALVRDRVPSLSEPPLRPSTPLTPDALVLEVKPNAAPVPMYPTPATTRQPVALLRLGDVFSLAGEKQGDWIRVRLADGRTGYVDWRHVRRQ